MLVANSGMGVRGCGRHTGWGRENTAIRLNDGQELVVAIKFQIRNVRTGPAVDDQFVQHLELFALLDVRRHRRPGRRRRRRRCCPRTSPRPINRTRKPHAQIDAHALLAQHAIEMGPVSGELEIGQKAETAEAEAQDGRDDALEEPGGEEHGAVAAEGEDEVEFLGTGPAQIGRPVLEHVRELGVPGHEAGGVETGGLAQFAVDVDVDAQVGAVARRRQQPFGQFARQQHELVVARFGDDHDVSHRAFDGSALELFGDFAHARGRLHQPRVRHPLIAGDLFEHAFDVHGVVEALVVEAWRLERGEAGGGGGQVALWHGELQFGEGGGEAVGGGGFGVGAFGRAEEAGEGGCQGHGRVAGVGGSGGEGFEDGLPRDGFD